MGLGLCLRDERARDRVARAAVAACIAILLGLSAATAGAAALEEVGPVRTDPGRGCSLRLAGTIQPGDADRLAGLL